MGVDGRRPLARPAPRPRQASPTARPPHAQRSRAGLRVLPAGSPSHVAVGWHGKAARVSVGLGPLQPLRPWVFAESCASWERPRGEPKGRAARGRGRVRGQGWWAGTVMVGGGGRRTSASRPRSVGRAPCPGVRRARAPGRPGPPLLTGQVASQLWTREGGLLGVSVCLPWARLLGASSGHLRFCLFPPTLTKPRLLLLILRPARKSRRIWCTRPVRRSSGHVTRNRAS